MGVRKLIVELNVSEVQTQRHQIQLNPSPNESKSRTRSTGRMFKPQFGLPNGLQTRQSYCRIERLDETNPTSLRTQNSDTSKSENYPSDCPYARDSTSAVHSNHSQIALDSPLIYGGLLVEKRLERVLRVSRAPTPPPVNSRALPPTTAGLPPSHQSTPELCQITTRGLMSYWTTT
ncbi:hypothetical protein M5K25_014176 [Dendrobium thyrsiflorum]|uniref:Uncharacterized protein n=1 Tax=Dendrobium thyrsiflorum TaxID=117978 RepID=A0ABD0V2Q6_DENTH